MLVGPCQNEIQFQEIAAVKKKLANEQATVIVLRTLNRGEK